MIIRVLITHFIKKQALWNKFDAMENELEPW